MKKSGCLADNKRGMSETSDLSDFFNGIPVALYRSAPDGTLLAANQAMADLLGYATVAEAKAHVTDVESVYVDPSQRGAWVERIGRLGVIHDFDVELRRRDGSTVWVRDSARSVKDHDGRVLRYEGSLVDVTDKIQAQRDRDAFMATVSHELRNPIAAIYGLGEELSKNYDSFSDMERREVAELIARQAEDTGWLVEDLLVAYRGDVGNVSIVLETFDVVKQVERVLEVASPGIEVRVNAGSTDVHCDPQRTRQILRNLISNADRYGGDRIQVVIGRSGDRVEVGVRDSGPPLDGMEVERIFKPFERGSGTTHPKSVGLGLSVARRLARLMDGDLTYSHNGEWATFKLSLPAD